MKEIVRRELRVAFSKRAQPVWFRVVKWIVFVSVTYSLRRSSALKVWLLGMTLAGLTVHFFYRWKTESWTKAWGGWDDVAAVE